VDQRLGLLDRLAGCFTDYRNPNSIEHSVHELVAQRVYGLALGYEDLNDHDALRADSVLALLVGKRDLTGERRERERDRGYPLAGSSTLNRLELSTPESAAGDRYKRSPRTPLRWIVCWWICSSSPTTSHRGRSGWIWMRRMIRCTATRKGGSSTATTAVTAICRCTSSAASICCARGCERRTRMVRPGALKNSSGSSARSARAGRRRGS
jgi:hypothetical protein